MGRPYLSREITGKPKQLIHPVWRGIGCLFVIMIPILAYAAAILFLQADYKYGWFPISYQLAQTVTIPFVGSFPSLYAILVTTVVFSVILFGVFTAVYSIIYSVAGPPRYSPLDAPEQEKRYKHRLR